MEKIILSAENVSAWYGSTLAVDSISLQVEEGSVCALIGPSGCGKSTFIRTINRLHEEVRGTKVSGKILLEGQNIYGKNVDPVDVRKKIGMVFQKPNPFPVLSIEENALAGLRLSGEKNRSVLKEALEKSLKGAALWSEVKDQLDAPGLSLSGGQQQRLCIARALAVNPSVLLMDEPTSALDPISTAKIEELIAELKKRTTILIVTHNMQQAARISDQTAFFLSGKLIEKSSTRELFSNPREIRTKEYISGQFG